MKITIRKPLGYSQIGRKDQQEDAVWPLFTDVTEENRCIVLCDGVGGSEHGEVASQTSSKVIGEYLSQILAKSDYVCDEDVQGAVNLAYDELERIDADNAGSSKVSMATTLTCVCFHQDGILAAHMGDSRIYHVRPEEGLKYQSDDHSLVNALLKSGELTPEEAENFPRKNVITKAIQPHCERRFKAEVHQLTDVQSGDYLFLCCDGVLEQLTNQRLVEILSKSCPDEEKIKLLEAESTGKTKDNYTAYLIPINNVEGESTLVQDDISADVVEEEMVEQPVVSPVRATEQINNQKPKVYPETPTQNTKKTSTLTWILIAVIVILLAILASKFYFKDTFTIIDEEQPKEMVETELQNEESAKEQDEPTKKKANSKKEQTDSTKEKLKALEELVTSPEVTSATATEQDEPQNKQVDSPSVSKEDIVRSAKLLNLKK